MAGQWREISFVRRASSYRFFLLRRYAFSFYHPRNDARLQFFLFPLNEKEERRGRKKTAPDRNAIRSKFRDYTLLLLFLLVLITGEKGKKIPSFYDPESCAIEPLIISRHIALLSPVRSSTQCCHQYLLALFFEVISTTFLRIAFETNGPLPTDRGLLQPVKRYFKMFFTVRKKQGQICS